MNLLTQNRKMKKSGSRTFNFGITAKKTCPMAKDCLEFCYADKGAYKWSNVRPAFDRRYELTKTDDFIPDMCRDIKRRKPHRVRIHDSGDFYNVEYFGKWCAIAASFPDIEFYAYTKMISQSKGFAAWLPDNFTLIYSFGGKEDNLIDIENDRHSKVFIDLQELDQMGYIDASSNDALALTDNFKVGLMLH